MRGGTSSVRNGFLKVLLSFLISCVTSCELLNFGHLKGDGMGLVEPSTYIWVQSVLLTSF